MGVLFEVTFFSITVCLYFCGDLFGRDYVYRAGTVACIGNVLLSSDFMVICARQNYGVLLVLFNRKLHAVRVHYIVLVTLKCWFLTRVALDLSSKIHCPQLGQFVYVSLQGCFYPVVHVLFVICCNLNIMNPEADVL